VDTLSRSIPNPSIAKTTADVGPTQNITLLYSREEVGTASTVDTGIAQQFSHIQIWHLFAGPSQTGLCFVLSMGPKKTMHTLNVVELMM
jgi:hypothetical protein